MNIHTLVRCLLVTAEFGRIVEAVDVARNKEEIQKLPKGLGVYDENGEFFMITNQENEQTESPRPITFTLYTRRKSSEGQDLRINNASSVTASTFDCNEETYFITHGWRSSGHDEACTLIRDAYLEHTDSNVIVVDWSGYSMTINYIDASYKVKIVGEEVGRMIKLLYSNNLKAENLTLIGHSLGAHVMGIAGHNVRPKVGRIVGLDPALPMFHFARVGEALTRDDAAHVQIIHTNAGGLGYACPRGHTDFFPNGGVRQAGCCGGSIVKCAACSHSLAYKFFAESIARTFLATKCASYVLFESKICGIAAYTAPMGGFDFDNVRPGTYYLRTSDREPFSETFGKPFSRADITPFFANAICDIVEIPTKVQKTIEHSVSAVVDGGISLVSG